MLNNRQLRFIDEYMIDSNASAAYVRAGYSPNNPDGNSYKLLRNPEIAEEIKRRQESITKKVMISREQIIQDLLEIKNDNKQERPLISIKAIEVINRMLGFDEPQNTMEETETQQINIKIIKNGDTSH